MATGILVSRTAPPRRTIIREMVSLVSEACDGALEDTDAIWRMTMAADELAENLYKYATDDPVKVELEITEIAGHHIVTLRASNRATPDRLRDVDDCLRALMAAADPVAHYDALIGKSATVDETSGLGLARLRAELGLDLNYAIVGDQFTIAVQMIVKHRERT